MHADIVFSAPHPDDRTGEAPNHALLGMIGRLRFAAASCLSVRFPGCECGLCVAACPIGAIGQEAGAPNLRGDCIGCGQCSAACPTAALQTDGFALPGECPTDAETLFIDCWRVPLAESPRGAWRVPCFGGITTGWLLALFDLMAAQDERPIHLLDRGGCATCPAGSGLSACHAAIEETRALLTACGVPPAVLPRATFRPARLALAPAIPTAASALTMDRRGFFRGLMGGVARTADELKSATAPAAPITLRHDTVPIERMRIVTALARISARHGRTVPVRVLPQLSVADCDAHGVCARVCPTGALQRREDGGMAELRFFAALCVTCGQCARSCPDRAIRLLSEGGQPDFDVLVSWQAQECEVCGEMFFGAGGETCPTCSRQAGLQQGLAALFRPSA